MFIFLLIELRGISELKIEFAAVLGGDVDWVYEGRKACRGCGVGADEEFGGGDGVEPAFYPAPDCGEERGGTDYLEKNKPKIGDKGRKHVQISYLKFLGSEL